MIILIGTYLVDDLVNIIISFKFSSNHNNHANFIVFLHSYTLIDGFVALADIANMVMSEASRDILLPF